MPELPEVETIRRGLEDKLPGHIVESIEIKLPKLLINTDSKGLTEALVRHKFTQVRRLPDTNEFTVHPITGLQRAKGQFEPDKHTHIILYLDGHTSLCYRDIRQFGKWYLYAKNELKNAPELNSLGPDPFGSDYTIDNFAKGLKKTSRAIKTALLDQSIVAGLGNIYADEVLFASHILPTRSAKSLTDSEIEAIFNVIKPILQKSIDNRGTTFSDYRDADGHKGNNAAQLKVYGRGGQPCLVCGQELRKETIGGRSSVYCPNCQH